MGRKTPGTVLRGRLDSAVQSGNISGRSWAPAEAERDLSPSSTLRGEHYALPQTSHVYDGDGNSTLKDCHDSDRSSA